MNPNKPKYLMTQMEKAIMQYAWALDGAPIPECDLYVYLRTNGMLTTLEELPYVLKILNTARLLKIIDYNDYYCYAAAGTEQDYNALPDGSLFSSIYNRICTIVRSWKNTTPAQVAKVKSMLDNL